MNEPVVRAVGPSKGRVEAFSDGVFAVAITLLVLDIALDRKADPGMLWHDLGGLGYHYAAYSISFLTIGIMWVNHHTVFSKVSSVDHALLYENIFLLAVISFLPFPTGVLSEYVGDGGDNEKAAVVLYGLTMIVLSLAFTLLWLHLYRRDDVRAAGISRANVRRDMLRAGGAGVVYLVTVAVAFVAPVVSLVVYALIAIGFVAVRPPAEAA